MSRKGENIFKRKDGRWEGRYIKGRTPQGKAQYGSVYGKSYGAAKEKLRLKIAELDQLPPRRTVSPSGAMPFSQLAENWLSARRPNVKDSTYIKYRNLLNNYLLPKIGPLPIRKLTPEDLTQHYHWLLTEAGRARQGVSQKTAGDVFTVLRGILAYGRMQKLPIGCTGEEVTIRCPRKELQILSVREQKQLVQYLSRHPSRCGLGILLCLYTGLRLGEVCALRWEDISFQENTIYIHQTMQRLQLECSKGRRTAVVVTAPKTASSTRLIPIPPAIRPVLKQFRAPRGYVLTGDETYVEPRSMENHFKRTLKNAGLENVNFHCLRHTFATLCVEAGFDVKTLSEILGHANVSITLNRYVHPTMQMKQENMARIGQIWAARQQEAEW